MTLRGKYGHWVVNNAHEITLTTELNILIKYLGISHVWAFIFWER
jgi:hypothetical protein